MNSPRKLFISPCVLLLVLLPLGFAQQVSFRITPLRPVEELRAEALKEQPPREQGTFLKSDLVELTTLDPTIKLDITLPRTISSERPSTPRRVPFFSGQRRKHCFARNAS